MDLFQEPTFTACIAVVVSLVVAKVVSFAVYNSCADCKTAVCSVNEGTVAKEVISNGGLRVRNTKSRKRLAFVDDVVVEKGSCYESENVSKNLVLSDEAKSVDKFGGNEISEDSVVKTSDQQMCNRDDDRDKVCENIDMLVDLVDNRLKSLIVDEKKNEGVLGSDDDMDMVVDREEGNRVAGCGENGGVMRENVEGEEEEEVREEDDDWVEVERTELDPSFLSRYYQLVYWD